MNATTHYAKIALIVMLAMLLTACQPILSDRIEEAAAGDAMPASEETAEEAAESAPASPVMTEEGDAAMATVATRSLRVRAAPDGEAEVIFGLSEGDVQPVLGLSDDGEWVNLAIDGAPDGNGWVAANLVSINGTLPAAADSGDAMSEDATSEDAAASDAAAEAAAAPEPPESGFATVFTDGTRLRVREAPSVDAEIAGYIYNGETYAVLATSEDGQWIQIPGAETESTDNPNGGWVAVDFMVIGE